MSKSKLENDLAWQISQVLPNFPYIREYRFDSKKKWKTDFVFLDQKLIVEVEGGVWIKGRHTRPVGFTKDCIKYNNATIQGFRVLRVTGDHVKSGQAIDWIEKALNNSPKNDNIST